MRFFLQKLNGVNPQTVDRGGTLIGDAIRQALHAFGTLEHNYKDIILITDGEDHESFPLEAAQAAADQQVNIYTIGLGNPSTGTKIPIRNDQGQRSYLQYQGQEIRSKMQQDLLLEIAQRTGGAYVPAGTRAIELDRIYTDFIAPKTRRHIDVATRERLIHRYQWFVLAALILLAAEMLIQDRRVRAHGQET